MKLDLAEDQGERELEDITNYEAVGGSHMYAALATRPDILYAVTALSPYTLRLFPRHMTAETRVLQYLKFTADFQLHFNGNGIGIGIGIGIGTNIDIVIDIGNTLVGYSDSNWANDSANHKPQGGHVFLASNVAIM